MNKKQVIILQIHSDDKLTLKLKICPRGGRNVAYISHGKLVAVTNHKALYKSLDSL